MDITPTIPERPAELAALEARCAVLHDERLALQAELNELQTSAWSAAQQNVTAIGLAAQRLADGDDDAAPRDAEVIRKRLEVIRAAEAVVRGRIAGLHDRHAERTARAFRPAHRACVARIAKAVVELAAANRAEQDLRGMVPGIRLRPADYPGIGQFGPRGDPCEVWRTYVRNNGLLGDDDGDSLLAAE